MSVDTNSSAWNVAPVGFSTDVLRGLMPGIPGKDELLKRLNDGTVMQESSAKIHMGNASAHTSIRRHDPAACYCCDHIQYNEKVASPTSSWDGHRYLFPTSPQP